MTPRQPPATPRPSRQPPLDQEAQPQVHRPRPGASPLFSGREHTKPLPNKHH